MPLSGTSGGATRPITVDDSFVCSFMGLLLGVAILCLLPAPASASQTHRFREDFSSSAQPNFSGPAALAVAPEGAPDAGDLYVTDVGVDEVQTVTLEGGPTGGSFNLSFKGCQTSSLAVQGTTSPSADEVLDALAALSCIGEGNVGVRQSGALPGVVTYSIAFSSGLATTDVPQLACDGSGLNGGAAASCGVTTETPGVSSKIERFKSNGEPDDFTALGGNAIEGLAISFPELTQIAIAPPGAPGGTAGDIYVTLRETREVDVFAESGALLGQLNEFREGADALGPNKPIAGPCGVTVDGSGAVYLGDGPNGQVHKYLPTSNPPAPSQNVANFSVGEANCNLAAGAGASAGSVAVDLLFAGLFKVDSTSGATAYEIRAGVRQAIAVDPTNGHVLVAEGAEVSEYDISGTEPKLLSTFAVPAEVHGIAIDAASDVYVSVAGDSHLEIYGPATVVDVAASRAVKVGKVSAEVEAQINDEGTTVTECFFEYGVTTAYGNVAPCATVDGTPISAPGEIPADGGLHAVSAQINGLSKNIAYHFRLHIANSVAPTIGNDVEFETLGPPRISGETVSNVTTGAAVVSGLVEPRGELTSFFVEYVTGAQFEASGYAGASALPVTPKPVGAGIASIAVSEVIGGLAPGTVYHARLVAKNQSEPAVRGGDLVFATFFEAGSLPDGRVYEMVSPPAKGGEVFPPEGLGALGGSCRKCLPGAERAKMPMQITPDGNSLAYEGQPFAPGLGSEANEYVAHRDSLTGWATEGLSRPEYRTNTPAPGFQRGGFLALSPELSRGVMFQADPALSPQAPAHYANLYLWQRGSEALEPLITAPPAHRPPSGPYPPSFLPIFGGANAGAEAAAAFHHVVFEANDSLTAAVPGIAPKAPDGAGIENDVYEWNDGHLALVSVLPNNGSAVPDAVVGSGHLFEEDPNSEGPVFDRAISADGSRIFWTDVANGHLFVRVDGKETREIPDTSGFLTASADGGRVLLNDGHIYSWEKKQTADLTGGKGGFQGILGASEDLSRVYFIDTEALTSPNAKNANAEHAEPGADNLYLWHEGARTFIGRLLPRDDIAFGTQLSMGAWKPSISQRTSQVTGDGRFLAFTSVARLTGYDNTHRGGGVCGNSKAVTACWEVFIYDAQTGKLTCASCNPSKERPLGYSNLSLIENGSAAFMPPPRNLNANGRVFFESQDTLSPNDANGNVQDIYEWEPNGVGDCTREAGCVALISSGSSSNDSQFLGASESGDDVFITTRQQLLPQDRDDFIDIYDARVGGALFPTGSGAPCDGEECKGPTAGSPGDTGSGTASFVGPANPPVKHHRRKHRKKKHHAKRHHSRHHKKNHHHHRPGATKNKARSNGR
jgi:hypothetical protein